MIKVEQTIRNTVAGDCVRACICSIFHLDIESTPNFIEWEDDKWLKVLRDFLSSWNIRAIYLQCTEETFNEEFMLSIPGYVLACGKTERGTSHCCVYYKGELEWDPLGEDAPGLETVSSIMFFTWDHIYDAIKPYMVR